MGEDGAWDQSISTNSSNTSFQMTDLMPFTVYSFRTIAVNSLGISLPSKESYYIVTLREGKIVEYWRINCFLADMFSDNGRWNCESDISTLTIKTVRAG